MTNFIKEIKDHNINKALALETVGRTSGEDFNKAIDEVADTLNKSFLDGLIDEQAVEVDFKNLDVILEKARPHKYYRREGSPGNYKYYYTKEEYEKEKKESSGGSKNQSQSYTEEDMAKYEDVITDIGQMVDDSVYQNYIKFKGDVPESVLKDLRTLRRNIKSREYDEESLQETDSYKRVKEFLAGWESTDHKKKVEGRKEKGTNKLLKLIERIYEEKIDSFKLEGNQLYVQLETGKGYSSDGWSMSGIWDNEKLIIGSQIWTKDSYTNSKSKVTNKRSAYRNKPKEFDLVDALLITKVGPITINIAQELD